jgi:hypothetical protein
MPPVEVFKTNVPETETAHRLITRLHSLLPGNRINFDLADCDKILRIEGENIIPVVVIETLISEGYSCNILE